VADLPLFPLQTVLFPGALLPLHIFEPRYQLLVRRCVERQTPFGVVLIRSGPEVGGALAIDAAERQALLELATAAERLAEETRILRRETELLRDLLVRLRARGERGTLN
jgi:Lon protease-like protein